MSATLFINAYQRKNVQDTEDKDLADIDCKPNYTVHYKFDGDFTPIRNWLESNCSGGFEYDIKARPRNPSLMVDVVLKFEKDEDRLKFKDMVLSGRQL